MWEQDENSARTFSLFLALPPDDRHACRQCTSEPGKHQHRSLGQQIKPKHHNEADGVPSRWYRVHARDL
jgi:hypothetical protein